MQYREAVKACRKLGTQMEEHAEAAGNASRTYEATMTLFNVAASCNDEEAMQRHRDTLHTTVDIILDSGAMISKLTREQKVISNAITDFPA